MNEAMRVLWLRMMADRRKFGLMCMLMAIGLLLWGRLIILQRVPRSSYARPEAPVAPAAIEGSTASGATSEPPIVKVKTATNLSRDPFVPPASYEQLLSPPNPSDLAGDEKPEEPEPDPDEVRRALQAEVEKEAAKLRVSSVIFGRTAAAVVNGRLLEVGDEIDGFVVREVRARSVLVEKRGVEIELRMPTP